MASGRAVTYVLNLQTNSMHQQLRSLESEATRLDGSMWQLQKTLASFGLGLGAHFVGDFIKDAVQGAADYEVAMLRIKNASQDTQTGIKNTFFINHIVDEFKLKLEESADAYGSFLFKIKNAHISSTAKNQLFEELTAVGKVGGLKEQELDAVVRNVSIMLGEGILEARHLRMLSYVHPQVLPYLADLLGFDKKKMSNAAGTEDEQSALQQFSQLISSGKLTKMGVNSDVILEAFHKYFEDIKHKIPESLSTAQSSLNEFSNEWVRFKNSLVLDQKPELVQFLNEITNDIKWLRENEGAIIHWGATAANLLKIFIEFKVAMAAINFIGATYSSFVVGISGAEEKAAIATMQSANAFRLQAGALEMVNAQLLIMTSLKLGISPVQLSEDLALAGFGAKGAAITAGSVATNGGWMSTLSKFATGLTIAYFTSEALSQLANNKGQNGFHLSGMDTFTYLTSPGEFDKKKSYDMIQHILDTNNDPTYGGIGKYKYIENRLRKTNNLYSATAIDELNDLFGFDELGQQNKDDSSSTSEMKKAGILDHLIQLSNNRKFFKENILPNLEENNVDGLGNIGYSIKTRFDSSNYKAGDHKHNYKLPESPHDRIKGNSSHYVTINIHELNGTKNSKFEIRKDEGESVEEFDVRVGNSMARVLTGVVNDSQDIGK